MSIMSSSSTVADAHALLSRERGSKILVEKMPSWHSSVGRASVLSHAVRQWHTWSGT